MKNREIWNLLKLWVIVEAGGIDVLSEGMLGDISDGRDRD